MAYLTRFGSFWGFVPQSSGRVFWVAPTATYTVEGNAYSASDNNDGLSPERAFLTLTYAFTKCTANVSDVIMLLPGAHSWSATAACNVAGVTICGIRHGIPLERSRMPGSSTRLPASITVSAATTAVLTVTAADVEIAYLHIIPVAGAGGIAPSAAADRLYVHDCTFAITTAANTATMGVDVTFTGTSSSLDDVVVRNCYFHIADNQGPAIRLGATCLDMIIENSTFKLVGDTAWDDGIESPLAGTLGLFIRDCDFLQRSTGTVITDCIDTTGQTIDGSTTLIRCYFAVGSDPIEDSNVADMQVAENYLLQGAASVGGTLILGT